MHEARFVAPPPKKQRSRPYLPPPHKRAKYLKISHIADVWHLVVQDPPVPV